MMLWYTDWDWSVERNAARDWLMQGGRSFGSLLLAAPGLSNGSGGALEEGRGRARGRGSDSDCYRPNRHTPEGPVEGNGACRRLPRGSSRPEPAH